MGAPAPIRVSRRTSGLHAADNEGISSRAMENPLREAPAGTHLSRIAERLAAIDVPGAFATSVTRSSAGFRISVKEVGPLAWPLRRSDVQRLIAVARPARYGLRDETRLDPRVRDAWEIPARRVVVEEEPWQRIIDPVLTDFRHDLGLSEGVRLRAALHNLLVYQPGQFFRAHQDSEKTNEMVGTLAVILPSTFTGGALVVEHDRQKRAFRGVSGKLTFVAFYADCYHQVQPVKTGYRVALTYNLMLEGAARSAVPVGAGLEALATSVNAYFQSSRPSGVGFPEKRDLPDRLVYLLDHQYTRRALGWDRLKRADAARAAALREIATRLDCEIALALADVHEQWSSEDEELSYHEGCGGHRQWDGDEDDDASGSDDDDAFENNDGPTLVDLIDSDLELRYWLDADGRPMKSEAHVPMAEVCCTRDSTDFQPFASEHEGYMGNWGNTVDRWYHRAAVVLWPRSRNFVIRAKMVPSWAVGELLKTAARRGGRDEARERARTLEPFWSAVAWQETSPTFFERSLKLAAALSDSVLAAFLVEPLALESLSPKAARLVPPLVDAYGFEWATDMAGRWRDRRTMDQAGRGAWLVHLPAVCRVIRTHASSDATRFAGWLVRDQWMWLSAELRAAIALTPPATALDGLVRFSPACLGILECSRVVRDEDLHREMVTLLTSDDAAFPVEAGVYLLRLARQEGGRDEPSRFGLQAVHAHCESVLAARMQIPMRERGNWSIALPGRCRCPLCRMFGEFLAATDRIQFDWPLAKDGRSHVHRVIDAHALPVTHVTRRSGRPFTLVLRKTEALFEREAEQRRTWQRDLAWLRRTSRPRGATGARELR